MEVDQVPDIRTTIPKNPVAAIFVIAEYFEGMWPEDHYGRPDFLTLGELDQIQIENTSHALKIIVSAHSRIESIVPLPGDVLKPFMNDEMHLDPTCYTFLTKMMPLEARKFSARIAERSDVDFFDDADPEPYFDLDGNEKVEVFDLISQIRKIINESSFINDNHKRRLLRRIDRIEFELHKPLGLFDTVLAGAKEIFDVAEYAGNKSKPLVDRYAEIKRITQSKTKDYDALDPPEEPKRLPSPDEQDDT